MYVYVYVYVYIQTYIYKLIYIYTSKCSAQVHQGWPLCYANRTYLIRPLVLLISHTAVRLCLLFYACVYCFTLHTHKVAVHYRLSKPKSLMLYVLRNL